MIETERLIIRPVEFTDEHFILELLNEPQFINNIGDKNVRSLADARDYMEKGPLTCQQQNGFSLMTVKLKTGELIGLCGLLKRDELQYPDLGYAYLAKYFRRGYGYEAAAGVLKHFHHIRPMLAITSEENFASKQLLQKLGFVEQSLKTKQTEEAICTYMLKGRN